MAGHGVDLVTLMSSSTDTSQFTGVKYDHPNSIRF
jgi:hypothetical protein